MIGRTCNVHAVELLMGESEGKNHLPDLGVDGRIMLKWILNNQGVVWIETAQDRAQWRAFVNTVVDLRVPYEAVSFLTTTSF